MTASPATLGQLDELDRRIIVALQMDGRSSWTAIAERVGTSVATVARRGQQLLAAGTVRVAVVRDIHHAGPAHLLIVRLGCEPGRAGAVAEQLVRRRNVRFLAVVTGTVDVIAELSVLKSDSLYSHLVDEVHAIDGVQSCETDLLLHPFKVSHDWSRQLLTGEDRFHRTDEPHACHPSHFDETDHAMLELFGDDGRAAFKTVADALGVHESTVRRRFETLLAEGCVDVVTLVPAAALGFESEILFLITVEPGRLDAVARALADYRGVRYVAATLGSGSLMCEVILATTEDVFQFVTNVLGSMDGVRGWTAGMELLTYKRGFVETPWSRGGARPAAGRVDAQPVAGRGRLAVSGAGGTRPPGRRRP